MEKVYICTQCNAEYDTPGICEMCDVELILQTEEDENSDTATTGDRFGEFAEEDDEISDDPKEEKEDVLEEEPYMEMNEDEENIS